MTPAEAASVEGKKKKERAPRTPQPRRLGSVQAAAEYLDCSQDTVLRLINTGCISVVKLPVARTDGANRRLLVDFVELDELIPRWRERRTEPNGKG
jgi:excisionase family DNA binding protein